MDRVPLKDQRLRAAGPWPSLSMRAASILIAVVLYPFIFIGAQAAWVNRGTRVEDWIPESFAETRQLHQFLERFGNDELLMISWEGLQLGDDRLQTFRERLIAPDPNDERSRVLFNEVLTGDSVLESMTSAPLSLTPLQAKVRMSGWILGKDNHSGAIAIVSRKGFLDRRAAINHARQVASDVSGLPQTQIHFAGPTIDSVAIDETTESSLLKLSGFSGLVCFVILFVCIRHIWATVVIFGISLYCQQLALAVIHYSGGRLDSILLLTANLAGILSLSAAIHMYGYYRDSRTSNHQRGSVGIAFRRALWPTFLAAITTAIGFGSLASSEFRPIHNFGFYSAIVASVSVMLTLWYLAQYLPSGTRDLPSGARGVTAGPANRTLEKAAIVPHYAKWHVQVINRRRFIIATSLVILMLGAAGTLRLKSAIGIHELLSPEAKLIQDYRWIENQIGPLVPIEVVLEVPNQMGSDLWDELQWVAQLHRRINTTDGVGGAISALNFIPPLPSTTTKHSIGAIIERRVFASRLERSFESLQSLHIVHQSTHNRAWRISARVSGSEATDYTGLLKRISSVANDCLIDIGKPKLNVAISGGVPLAAMAQERLLADLSQSLMMAVVLIGTTLTVVLSSARAGLLALIPNVLPAFVVFGIMGYFGWAVEVGSIMTASAVLGIAVDDSLHLIMAFRGEYARCRDRQQAVARAMATCVPAVVQTSMVVGLGMIVFVLSPFVPIQRFSLVMFTLMAVALAADMLLLPALLASRLGTFFVDRTEIAESKY